MAEFKHRSIGEVLPSGDNGPALEDAGLEGQEVVIASVAFENRKGDQGDYTLTVITLDDGTVFHTSSAVIVDQLGPINPKDWPMRAMFVRIKSRRNPRYSYWSVVDPDNHTATATK